MDDNSQKRSDILLLIQARLYGWSGTNTDRAKRLDLPLEIVSNLMRGDGSGFNAHQLSAIARKAGINSRILIV